MRDIANTLNTLPDEEENPYAKAADRLTHPEEDEEDGQPRRSRRRRRKRADGPRLDGTPEDEREPENEGPFAEAHPHRPAEYEAVEDAPRVRRELDNRVLYLTVSTVVSGVAALVMIYLGIAATGSVLPMPAMLVPTATAETAAAAAGAMVSASAAPLMTVLLVLLLAVCGLNWKTMFCGLRGLVQEPTADTMPALAAVGALIQLLVFLIQPGWYLPSSFCLLAGPAALLLCGNAVGKQIDACTTRANFDLVSAGVDHAVAYRLRDATVLRTVTRGPGRTQTQPAGQPSHPAAQTLPGRQRCPPHLGQEPAAVQLGGGRLRPAQPGVHAGLPPGPRHGIHRLCGGALPGCPAVRHTDLRHPSPSDAAQRCPGGAPSSPAGRTSASWAAST